MANLYAEFDGVRTDNPLLNLRMILQSYTISPPEIKQSVINVPASDGVIDLSENLVGYKIYKQREIYLTFTRVLDSMMGRDAFRYAVTRLFDGRYFKKIILGDAPGVYWSGRASVESFTVTGANTIEVVVKAVVEPYGILTSNPQTVTEHVQKLVGPMGVFDFKNIFVNEDEEEVTSAVTATSNILDMRGLSTINVTVGTSLTWSFIEYDRNLQRVRATSPRTGSADFTLAWATEFVRVVLKNSDGSPISATSATVSIKDGLGAGSAIGVRLERNERMKEFIAVPTCDMTAIMDGDTYTLSANVRNKLYLPFVPNVDNYIHFAVVGSPSGTQSVTMYKTIGKL